MHGGCPRPAKKQTEYPPYNEAPKVVDFWGNTLFLIALVAGMIWGKRWLIRRRESLEQRLGMPALDAMDVHGFGNTVLHLLSGQGFSVQAPKESREGFRELKRQGERWVVLTVIRDPAGLQEVQAVARERDRAGADKALLVARRGVSYPAREVAGREKVEVWDRRALMREMRETGFRATAPTEKGGSPERQARA